MIVLFLSVVLFGGAVEPVVAQTAKQRAAMKHLAEAAVLAELCPTLKVNTDRMFLIMVGHDMLGGDPETGPIAKGLRAGRRKAEDDAKGLGGNPDVACVAGLVMFGPTGGNVENLLIKR